MVRPMGALIGLGLILAPAAVAQQGQELYQQNCALCHRDSGVGDPPAFPALSGNDRLRDLDRIVRSIHEGGRRMPPFPALAAGEISSVASFIRTAWTNDYGPVSTEEVAAELVEPAESAVMASVWDGVFTEPQASRGEAVYTGACGFCHGRRLDGAADDPDMRSAPPLARARFLRIWEGRSLATLFEYTRATMPEDNPSSLTEQEYVDVIAYMLTVGGMPAGDEELRPDPSSLARVVVRLQP
jgi:mono/diheme cytochrome c family protein